MNDSRINIKNSTYRSFSHSNLQDKRRMLNRILGKANSQINLQIDNKKLNRKLKTQSFLQERTQSLPRMNKRIKNKPINLNSNTIPYKSYRQLLKNRLQDTQRDIQNSNRKINELHQQIGQLQIRTKKELQHGYGIELQNKIKYQKRNRQNIYKNLLILKRQIEQNSKQLLNKSQTNDFIFLNLQKQYANTIIKLEKLKINDQKIIKQNIQIIKKIQKYQLLIQQYKNKYLQLFPQINQQQSKKINYKFNQKKKRLNIFKLNGPQQIRRLQKIYFQKIKDLQYAMNGIDMIDDKNNQLDQRIKIQKERQRQLQNLLDLVKNSKYRQENHAIIVKQKHKKYQSFSFISIDSIQDNNQNNLYQFNMINLQKSADNLHQESIIH